jgi:transcription elongation factor Elf1
MDDRLFECPECGTAQDAGNDAHEGDLVTCKACGFTGELFKLDEGHTPTDADE